jgi:hypothetical protein
VGGLSLGREFAGVDAAGQHPQAVAGQALGDGAADTAGGAGDEARGEAGIV